MITILQTKNRLRIVLTKNLCNRSQKRTFDVYKNSLSAAYRDIFCNLDASSKNEIRNINYKRYC